MRLLFLCVLYFGALLAQSQNFDSLKVALTESYGADYANTAKTLATNYLRQNLYDSAESYYDLAIEVFKEVADNKQTGKCLNNKGVSNYMRGRFKEAVSLYQEALGYYRLLGNDTLTSQSLTNLGLTLKRLNVYDKALEYLYEAATILEKLNLKKDLAANWNAIGNIHREFDSMPLSYDYLNRSLELRNELNHVYGRAQSYHNIGTWYLEMDSIDSAIQFFQKALYLKQGFTDKKNLPTTLSKMGESYLRKSLIDSCKYYFEQSLKIRLELGDVHGVAVSSNHLAGLYLDTKRYSEALRSLKTAEEFGKKAQTLEATAITYSLLKDYYSNQGLYESALVYANLFGEVRKEIIDKEKARSLMESEIRYEVDRKEKEILSQKAELATVQLKTTWLIFTIAILLLVVAALIWFYFLMRKLANERKVSKERVEGLLKELNHRTKNHLQSQLSLIKLQSGFLKDRSAKSVMREVGNRMKAITLVHQSLYGSSEEAPENINLSEYLRNLTENLMISFKFNRNKVALSYDFEEIDIDLHYAVPIGLIVNEAVTNAFKYAFSSKVPSPELKISLKKNDTNLSICIKDNGQGFRKEQQISKKSLGMTIMEDLAVQLKGQLTINNEKGVKVRLIFRY